MAYDKTTKSLKILLADTYAIYLKTQNYHWNITGENFHSLHKMFQNQYEELSEAIDVIAERIRALGQKAPGTFDAFMAMTMIKDANDKFDWKKMVRDLHQDHKAISNSIQKIIKVSEEEKDYVSNDLLIERLAYHQKVTWMLEVML